LIPFLCFSFSSVALRFVHSFPTRRSSDLLCLGAGPAHLPHRVDAVQRWHADVNDGDIGMQGLRVANRFLAIRCFSHYLELFPLEKGLQALSHQNMIVSQHYSN